MSELTEADIKTAAMVLQGGVQGCEEFAAGGRVLAAARAYLSPDYEAAHELLYQQARSKAWDVRAIVDAALAADREGEIVDTVRVPIPSLGGELPMIEVDTPGRYRVLPVPGGSSQP